MSDTPETDAVTNVWTGGYESAVSASFARRLERERNSAREECKRLIDIGVNGAGANCLSEMQRKLNEAKELLKLTEKFLELLGDELHETAVIARLHGWRSSRIEQGNALREKINQLKEGAK